MHLLLVTVANYVLLVLPLEKMLLLLQLDSLLRFADFAVDFSEISQVDIVGVMPVLIIIFTNTFF